MFMAKYGLNVISFIIPELIGEIIILLSAQLNHRVLYFKFQMNHIKEHLNKNTLLRLFKFNRHINLFARSILTMQSLTIR